MQLKYQVLVFFSLVGCTVNMASPPQQAPSSSGAECDPRGSWKLDDAVLYSFVISSENDGRYVVEDIAENIEAQVSVEKETGSCKVKIVAYVNETAGAGTPDIMQRTYELQERQGKVDGLLMVCRRVDGSCVDEPSTHSVTGHHQR
jgi:hypothetical protein